MESQQSDEISSGQCEYQLLFNSEFVCNDQDGFLDLNGIESFARTFFDQSNMTIGNGEALEHEEEEEEEATLDSNDVHSNLYKAVASVVSKQLSYREAVAQLFLFKKCPYLGHLTLHACLTKCLDM